MIQLQVCRAGGYHGDEEKWMRGKRIGLNSHICRGWKILRWLLLFWKMEGCPSVFRGWWSSVVRGVEPDWKGCFGRGWLFWVKTLIWMSILLQIASVWSCECAISEEWTGFRFDRICFRKRAQDLTSIRRYRATWRRCASWANENQIPR